MQCIAGLLKTDISGLENGKIAELFKRYGYNLYHFWFVMPQKIINLKMVNADIIIKKQTERSDSMRYFIT
jgi:hypothetical protein